MMARVKAAIQPMAISRPRIMLFIAVVGCWLNALRGGGSGKEKKGVGCYFSFLFR